MSLDRFQHRITTADDLVTLIGEPNELVIRKELTELDRHMKAFIAEAPFVLLGTYDRGGRCDVSPRGDLPSVAHVLDSRTLIMAERPGNRRADSLKNIIETGRVGMLFLIRGLGETLRVNGTACVVQDEAYLSPLTVNGKTPVLGIAVAIEECYLQCAKAVIRSKLWDEAPPLQTPSLSCFAEILIEQTQADQSVQSLDERIRESYEKRLF